jgi:hypothetical protein
MSVMDSISSQMCQPAFRQLCSVMSEENALRRPRFQMPSQLPTTAVGVTMRDKNL